MIDIGLTKLRPVLVAGLLLAATGCSDLLGVNQGNVRFVLSSGGGIVAAEPAATSLEDGAVAFDGDHDDDRPSRFFQSATVIFSSILARNLDGVLVDVKMDELPVAVEVVAMEGGRQVTLPDGELLPGTYDQVVVVMTEVRGVTHDGTTITIEPPGGGWTSIIAICPFDVGSEPTTVGIQFDLKQAFSWRNNRFHFQPRFVCEEEEAPPA